MINWEKEAKTKKEINSEKIEVENPKAEVEKPKPEKAAVIGKTISFEETEINQIIDVLKTTKQTDLVEIIGKTLYGTPEAVSKLYDLLVAVGIIQFRSIILKLRENL